MSKLFPRLEGWLTVKDASDLLGVSRQACHKMIEDGKFQVVRSLGQGIKPLYVIAEDEVHAMKATRGSK